MKEKNKNTRGNMLDTLLKAYLRSNKLKVKVRTEQTDKPINVNFGDVIEILFSNQLLVAVYVGNQEALLMSEFWEFAREKDLIVEFNHSIANKWIIQLDKRLYEVKNFSIAGSLSDSDKQMLRDVLAGKELPPSKTGPKIPPNPEDPRMKFGVEEAKKVLRYNASLYQEQENCIYFDFKKTYFKIEKQAAYDGETLFEQNGVFISIEQNAILIDATDKNIGKKIAIKLKLPNQTIVIHEDTILEPTFKIISKTPIKIPYAIKHMIEINIYG